MITGSDLFFCSVVLSTISRNLNDLELFYQPPRSSTSGEETTRGTHFYWYAGTTLPEEMERLCAEGGMT